MADRPALARIIAKADNYCHDLDMSSITPREAHRFIRSAYKLGLKHGRLEASIERIEDDNAGLPSIKEVKEDKQ